MNKKHILTLLILLLTAFFLSTCGKVTQEVALKEKKKEKFFTISFTVDVLATPNLAEKITKDPQFPSQNYFAILSKETFVTVYGIKNQIGFEELSWGKGILELKEEKVSENIKYKWISKTQNKNSVTINNSNLKETFLRLNSPTENIHEWHVRSTKIKYGFPIYFVKTFTNKDQYYFFVIDEKTASENTIFNKGTLGHYDTFISSLYLTSLKENDFMLNETPSIDTLKQIFSTGFFDLINYTLPKNTIKVFKPDKPEFKITRAFEKELLKVIDLLANTDKKETIRFIKQSKELKKLGKTTLKYLESNIESYSPKDIDPDKKEEEKIPTPSA